MTARTPPRTLQLEEDPEFHRASARIATATWVLLLSVMVAALLGAFGNGWLSRVRAGDEGDLRVEYDRFGRFGASMEMVVHPEPAEGAVDVGLSRSLVDAFQVVSVEPRPASSALAPGGVRFRFPADATGPVTFHLQPVRRWRIVGSIWSGRSSVPTTQFIYP